jgi:hypothetical protein
MNPVKIGFWPMALPVLLAVSQGAVANAEPLFDATKRVVLPSEAATTILEYVTDGSVRTGEWVIDPATLDLVEVALASALAKQGFGKMSLKTRDFYRQYMPAQWNGLHLIIVNGFYKSASDMFPDQGVDPGLWKHKLLWVFGGGCGFWQAIYIVEQNQLMVLTGRGRHATVLCNGPK